MKIVTLNVPMCARDALLLPFGCADGHRGVWFYDPKVYGEINVGDGVVFVSAGSELVRGVVTRKDGEFLPDNFRKYCSRVNGQVIQWEEMPQGNFSDTMSHAS